MHQNSILNNFELIDKVSEVSTTSLQVIEERTSLKENQLNKLERDKFCFPLNNSKQNLLNSTMLNNNLINNSLFIEFELTTLNKIIDGKENAYSFSNIDNEFVNKEIEFSLNVK